MSLEDLQFNPNPEPEPSNALANLLYLAENPPSNDIVYADKREQERLDRVAACGKEWSYKYDHSGSLKTVCFRCGDYRRCDNCRRVKAQEIEADLAYHQNRLPVGQRLKYTTVTDDEWEALQKKIKRDGGTFKRLAQADNVQIVVHSAENVEGTELWDTGFSDSDADLDFDEILKSIPDRKRISGSLKKPMVPPESEEGEGEKEEEQETFNIKVFHLYSANATKREINLADMKAVSETQGIDVTNVSQLEKALYKRILALYKALGDEDAIVYHSYENIKEEEVMRWNDNPNNGVT